MRGVRVVHAADIHLDSPLVGLARFADAETVGALWAASRGALANLVCYAIDQDADAVVLAGDIYDGDWRDYKTGRFFQQQMCHLHDAGIRVFMTAGNHDAESVVTRAVKLPDNVTIFKADEPHTEFDEDLGLAVHGQSFATRAVTHNLVRAYPDRVNGYANVGVLHTAADDAAGHANYAPCSPRDLSAVRYDYFALGHVHSRRIVNSGQWVAAFSGNLQGRHARETGPKGALVVDVLPEGGAQPEFVELDVARWASLKVDVTGARTFDDAMESVRVDLDAANEAAGGKRLVARVTLVGAAPAASELTDAERLRDAVDAEAPAWVTIEKVRSKVAAPSAGDRIDPELLTAIQRARAEPAGGLDDLGADVKVLASEVRAVLRRRGVDLASSEHHSQVRDNAIRALVAHLSGGA